MKIEKDKKEIKIGDHWLTLANYKEPLTEIPKEEGYGYWGTIACTLDGEYMQCHICGNLFYDVGSHARQAHKITLKDYRYKFQLMKTNVLISERERFKRKNRMIEYLKTLTEEEKQKRNEKASSRWKETGYAKRLLAGQPKKTLEGKNKDNSCPDQQLKIIKNCADAIGCTPSLKDLINYDNGSQRYKHLIFKTYGSWVNALKMLKMRPKEAKDVWSGKRSYDDEELLEYMRIYAQENNQIPTATDCKRGLLPAYDIYQRHFGSFIKAREMAGVMNFIEN